jgi:hypothetical protein
VSNSDYVLERSGKSNLRVLGRSTEETGTDCVQARVEAQEAAIPGLDRIVMMTVKGSPLKHVARNHINRK